MNYQPTFRYTRFTKVPNNSSNYYYSCSPLICENNICLCYFQNFESIPHIPDAEVSYYGGSVALADYCPYIQEFTWRSNNVVVRGSHCMYGENNPSKLIIFRNART